jgi:hypothetical protein
LKIQRLVTDTLITSKTTKRDRGAGIGSAVGKYCLVGKIAYIVRYAPGNGNFSPTLGGDPTRDEKEYRKKKDDSFHGLQMKY